jgi:hypothetical protein
MIFFVCLLKKLAIYPVGRLNFTRDQSSLIGMVAEDLTS